MFKSKSFQQFDRIWAKLYRMRFEGLFDETAEKRVALYVLVDPRDETVRYVGVTSDPERRAREHAAGATTNRNMRKWAGELRALGLEPSLRVVGSVTPRLWAKVEIRTIRNLRRAGALYNIADGGAFKPPAPLVEPKKLSRRKAKKARRTKKQEQICLRNRLREAKGQAIARSRFEMDVRMEALRLAAMATKPKLQFDETPDRILVSPK